ETWPPSGPPTSPTTPQSPSTAHPMPPANSTHSAATSPNSAPKTRKAWSHNFAQRRTPIFDQTSPPNTSTSPTSTIPRHSRHALSSRHFPFSLPTKNPKFSPGLPQASQKSSPHHTKTPARTFSRSRHSDTNSTCAHPHPT